MIKEMDSVDNIFLVKDKALSYGKNGKPYINLVLMDRTGEIQGKIWERAGEINKEFDKNDIIRIRSKTSTYQGIKQLIIYETEKIDKSTVDILEFLPKSKRDLDDMLLELMDILDEVDNEYLKKLLALFFEDDEFITLFKKAPAAKSIHHVFIGGLLEHTLSVCKIISTISNHYETVDKSLLLTGGFLHDIGKVRELSYENLFDYTDEGRLIGHIVIGVEIINERISKIKDFPEELSILLKHLVISHHGEYEFGSPKRPKTIEALILHSIEDMDAKINGFREFINKNKDNKDESKWTSYHRIYDRYIYKGNSLISK
jgi:3'-5' exoribonuclease